tara:strand:+ start:85286 stop:85858 length:573 start_codon:yes stop_codon:yes gene_type:complete
MARKRALRPEEKAIWKQVAKSVKPISAARLRSLDEPEALERKAKTPTPDTLPTPRSQLLSSTKPLEKQSFIPVDRKSEKRVRRGKLEIEARIDLHGLTQDIALRTLRNFLSMAHREGYRTVLVITGKGLKQRERTVEPWERVEEPGVLRRKLPEWLGNPEFSGWVSGYAEAHLKHGGGGAFYVTMRRRIS